MGENPRTRAKKKLFNFGSRSVSCHLFSSAAPSAAIDALPWEARPAIDRAAFASAPEREQRHGPVSLVANLTAMRVRSGDQRRAAARGALVRGLGHEVGELHRPRAITMNRVFFAIFEDRKAIAALVEAYRARLRFVYLDPVVLVEHDERTRLDGRPRDRNLVFVRDVPRELVDLVGVVVVRIRTRLVPCLPREVHRHKRGQSLGDYNRRTRAPNHKERGGPSGIAFNDTPGALRESEHIGEIYSGSAAHLALVRWQTIEITGQSEEVKRGHTVEAVPVPRRWVAHSLGPSLDALPDTVQRLEHGREIMKLSDDTRQRARRVHVVGHVVEQPRAAFGAEPFQVDQRRAAHDGTPHGKGLRRRVVASAVSFGGRSVGARALLRIRSELRPHRSREHRARVSFRNERNESTEQTETESERVAVGDEIRACGMDFGERVRKTAKERGALVVDVHNHGIRLDMRAELEQNLMHVGEAVEAHLFGGSAGFGKP